MHFLSIIIINKLILKHAERDTEKGSYVQASCSNTIILLSYLSTKQSKNHKLQITTY